MMTTGEKTMRDNERDQERQKKPLRCVMMRGNEDRKEEGW